MQLQLVKESEWLFEHLSDPDLRIIDCQFHLSNKTAGREQYRECHIPGAAFMDVAQGLSGPIKEHGGRHPLPAREDFIELMKAIGIHEQTTVIAYDGGEGAFAGRFLWTAQLFGYERVYVLNGGLKAWLEKVYPVTEDIPVLTPTDYAPVMNKNLLVTYPEVKDWAENDRPGYLIDSRESDRYKGIHEPIDHKAGHIPGAINMDWTENFRNGKYLPVPELENRFNHLNKDEPIIVYCGSGITATPNYIALKEAGFTNVKIYAGSFSDWISYPENRIETDQ
ncbi:sulfurtransferase [Bacillus sp. E214]|uniref:sulfurtransferase n=1 Tax=Bacillus sp. E214 TaxID=2587156 RepID=UPI0011E0023A|nr:sulfurtransferase [Bacillus sp. E214]